MIRSQPPIPERVPVLTFPTPRGKEDLVFYEVRDSRLPKNKEWCYGDAHPNKKEFPDHELVLVASDGGDAAWQRWYYAAVRERQNLYNWQYSNSPDWPVITQTFFVKRCDLPVNESELLPPPTEFIPDTGFVLTEREVGRAGDDMLESLYVTVTVKREQITSNPKISYVIDPQTNQVRTVTEEKIPSADAASAASAVDENGQYTEVRAATTRWAIKTTQFMQGLAGGGDGYTQEWTDVLNYSWPYVLRDVSYNVFPSPSGGIAKLTTTPRWLRERYDGPCEAIITETWTLNEPTPPLLEPMITTGIEFNGGLLQIGIPPCLHPAWYFYDSAGTNHPDFGYYFYREDYPATSLLDWPEEHIASFTVRPAMGGYISRTVKVKRPSGGTVFANIISLAPVEQGAVAGSVDLTWSRINPVGTLVRYRLDVNTKADFTGTFLTGFNNKNVGTATTHTVTGLTPGTIYFVRVKAVITVDSVDETFISNTQAAVAETVSSYTVFVNPQLFDGDTVDYGTVNVGGTPVVKTLTINNTGNVALSIPSATLSGTDSEYWTVTGPSLTTIPVAGSATVGLTFEPDTERSYSGAVSLDLTNAEPMNLVLTGSAGVPGISFTFRGVAASSGDTVNYDVDSQTGTLVISNPGTGNLTLSSISLTGTDADQWSLSPEFFDPITVLPGDSTSITVTYVPDEASAGHTAALNVAHDGGGSPFVLNLFGQAEIASLGFEWPSGTDQSYGFAIDLYATEGSPGTPVTETLVLKASGGIVPISIPSITISGTNSTMFSIVGQEGAPTSSITIPAGSSYTYDVTFDPGSSGIADYFGQLDFDHNDPDITQPAAISLVGHISSY